MKTTDTLHKLLEEATKGEWHQAGGFYVQAPKAGTVADCHPGYSDDINYDQAKANASLIAAAVNALPALVEIAEKAGELLEAEGNRRRHRKEMRAWSPEWRDESVRLEQVVAEKFARLEAAEAALEEA